MTGLTDLGVFTSYLYKKGFFVGLLFPSHITGLRLGSPEGSVDLGTMVVVELLTPTRLSGK